MPYDRPTLTAFILALAPAVVGLAWLLAAAIVMVRAHGAAAPSDVPERIASLLPQLNAVLRREVRVRRATPFVFAAFPVFSAGTAMTALAVSYLPSALDDLARAGQTTTGVVLASRPHGGYRRTDSIVTYRYAVGLLLYTASSSSPAGLRVGSRIQVVYLPGTPSVASAGTPDMLAERLRRDRRNGSGVALLALTTAITFGGLGWRRMRRAYHLARSGVFQVGTITDVARSRYHCRASFLVEGPGAGLHVRHAPILSTRRMPVRGDRVLLLADRADAARLEAYDTVRHWFEIDTPVPLPHRVDGEVR